MTTLTMPLHPGEPRYENTVELEGISYAFAYQWNERDGCWYMDIATPEGSAIASSIRVVLDYPLGFRVADARKPPGLLTAVDTTGSGQEPGPDDFGSRVLLLYLTSDEL